VGVDRTSKFAFARLVESAGKMEAAQFLRDLVEAVPYTIHTVLTDNRIQGVVQSGRFMGYTKSGQRHANQGIPRFVCNPDLNQADGTFT